MPRQIDGVPYFSAAEVIDAVEITRQTFWRWRREGKVPRGHRFRDGQVVFTEAELQEIQAHANHLEPISLASPDQLKLFNGST
jgi:predicted DNA-binding transcriptional regulator AlpA